MALEKELKIQSVVILAQNFNPSVFHRYWLVKNQFVKDEDILDGSVFAPTITQFATNVYSLTVLPDQLQFTSTNISPDHFNDAIESTLIPILEKLQEIPYKAIGINFSWFVKDAEMEISKLTKEMFYVKNSSLYDYFDSQNAKFGAFVSQDFKNTRMKLEAKPSFTPDSQSLSTIEHIQFIFNFHNDLSSENCVIELIDAIRNWNDYMNESRRIICLL